MSSKLKSIITNDLTHCLITGNSNVCFHHCLEGTSKRKLSDIDCLIVPLEPHIHNEGSKPEIGERCDVHHCRKMAVLMHSLGQLAWEKDYLAKKLANVNKNGLDNQTVDEWYEESRDAFRSRYGESFL